MGFCPRGGHAWHRHHSELRSDGIPHRAWPGQRVETTRGFIGADKVGLAVAGHTGHVAALAGFTLPVETHLLQAMVTEPVKPVLNTVVSFGAGHFYTNQTDKGEIVMGGDLDGYNSYAQRGNLPMIEHVAAAAVTAFPCFGRP